MQEFMGGSPVQPFHFKQFTIAQDQCTMKIGTDGVLLGAWADILEAKRILDIGTGTGVIAIMLAQRTQNAQIFAVEIDEAACSQASENMAASPWSDRLHAINVPIQEYEKSANQDFDLIVSNPPFFSGGTFSNHENRNNVRHTIKMPHGDLLGAVRTLLAPHGRFCLVLPLIEGMRFRELARSYNLYCTKMTEVIPKVDKQVERLLLQFERREIAMKKDQLVIQEQKRNEWTPDYIALTKAFYLAM